MERQLLIFYIYYQPDVPIGTNKCLFASCKDAWSVEKFSPVILRYIGTFGVHMLTGCQQLIRGLADL